MTNAFTIDTSKPSFAVALDKEKRQTRRMTEWVESQRSKGIEPCRVEMKNSPDPIKPTMLRGKK